MGSELGKSAGVPNERSIDLTTLEPAVTITQTQPRPRPGASAGLSIPARLTWKDANGAVRFASCRTRDVCDRGVVVECDARTALPLYRLVHVQIEKTARDTATLPAVLCGGRVLAAVWQVSPGRPDTGVPSSYALRFMTAAPRQAMLPETRRAS